MRLERVRVHQENALLRQERDLLKSDGLLRSGNKSMQFVCIATQKTYMSLARLCSYVGVSISGYYA